MPLDFSVEIDKMPGELGSQQAPHSALARAHETGQANQAAFRDGPGDRLLRLGIILQEIPSALVTLQNLDCTTKRRELNLGMTIVHGAKQALPVFRLRMMTTMSIRFE